MIRFGIVQSKKEILTSHAGLALAGQLLNRKTSLRQRARKSLPGGLIDSGDVVISFVGNLLLGQPDFEAIQNRRGDKVFKTTLGLRHVPSAETQRQRLDAFPEAFRWEVEDEAVELVRRTNAPVSALPGGWVPLDIDATALDNSGTKKEGVSYTYQGFAGYLAMGAYLGREGWCLGMELRPGSQHSQNGFVPFLQRVLARARPLVRPEQRLLVRLDSAHDALETLVALEEQREGVDWIVKWNPRKQDLVAWWERAEKEKCVLPEDPKRPRKRTAWIDEIVERRWQGRTVRFRRVVRLVRREADRHGQLLLTPEIEIEGWWTSVEVPGEKVAELYNGRGTSEQFHSEFKTDLNLERLPSGKFRTNALVLSLGVVAYNLLRLLGQKVLLGPGAPVRHPAQRRRIRTVIQELMYLAARVVRSGRRWWLRFGVHCPAFEAFARAYGWAATA